MYKVISNLNKVLEYKYYTSFNSKDYNALSMS
jgi:hypothetical protein